MRKLVGLALLGFALLQLGFRGMQRVRSDVPLWDFVSVHSASRTWIHGGDPYDLQSVTASWRQSGIFTDRDVSYFATVYPPTSLLVLAPLAVLPAPAAMVAWLLLTLVLLVTQYIALLDMARIPWRDSRALLLAGAALASAPLQFGILSGQLSLPAISLSVLAFWCAGRDKDTLAGVLLGLGCAIKPQVAGPFVVYYLLMRRFKLSAIAIVIAAVVGLAALVLMRFSQPNWLAGWTRSIAVTTAPGAVNDYGWANRFRDEIVDLKMLLVSVVKNPKVLQIVVECIVIAFAAWFVRSFFVAMPREKRTPRDELLALGAFAAVSLLPIYHRVYDIALLSTALAWALAEFDGPRRRFAVALLVPMALFLIPFDLVKSVGTRAPALMAASRTWWWQSIFAPHYAWGLLICTVVLLVTMSRATRGAHENPMSAAPESAGQ